MMQTSDMLRAYYSRVVPAIPELFNMAYAICGNYDLAEYALQYTLMEAWIGESHGGMGFREGLRNTLRRTAIEMALEPRSESPEFTWNGFDGDSDDEVMVQLAKESLETRRMAALRYGCGLSVGRIAKLTDQTNGRVRDALEGFERRVRRLLGPSESRRFESRISAAIRRELGRTDEGMPSLSTIYRSFETEAAETRRPSYRVSRLLRRGICVALALLCAVVFWFAAVLIQPTAMETPAQPQEIVQE